MKKRIAAACILSMIMLSIGLPVYASSNDTPWSYNGSAWGTYTVYRDKENNSWVYCHPESGAPTWVTVYGKSGTLAEAPESGTYKIPVGTYGMISNYVNETGRTQAKLKLERTSSGNIPYAGKWSPDSIEYSGVNYTYYY